MGPKGASKRFAPKHLCVYLVELDESSSTGVHEDTLRILRHCVMDKIFSESSDEVAICRSDRISTVEFVPANWDALRKVEYTFRETKLPEQGTKEMSCVSALLNICQVVVSQAREDSYEDKKILFFGHLNSQEIDEKAALRLAKMLAENEISISIIVTDEEFMNETQKSNRQVLEGVFEQEEYNEWGFVTSNKKARRQIMNTLTKKSTRPSPWNVELEIGPYVNIKVGGYVCTRKNKVGEMTKALMKSFPVSKPTEHNENATQSDTSSKYSNVPEPKSSEKTVMIEVAKNVTEKEIVWTEKDGNVVEEDNIGKGYFYGDKIVPFNELESEDLYKSGNKCLKVLVFCPITNIRPEYQLGDGTTLFYPKKEDMQSQLKFDALLKALHKNDRVAVVRKVYLQNKRVNIGVLSPDMERMCLVYSEICCADDVSVPHFATLIKEVPTENEGLTKQEGIIDDLITAMSIDEFYPGDGPVDPAMSIMRQNIACRILEEGQEEKRPWGSIHGMDIFFDEVVLKNDLLSKLKESFPLTINKEDVDRPAGSNIFRKRHRDDGQIVGDDEEKKMKIEKSENNGARNVDEESGFVTSGADAVDEEDLLDQL